MRFEELKCNIEAIINNNPDYLPLEEILQKNLW